jgi:tRNA guanosine-2'-O-methyltransferase
MEDLQETDRLTVSLRDLILGGGPSESHLVLGLFDEASKAECFEHFWKRLQASPDRIDVDALRLCIRLLPAGDQVSG